MISLVVIDNRAGDDPGIRAQQIGDQRRDLVRFDQLAHRQPGFGLLEPVVGRVMESLLHHMFAGVSIQPVQRRCNGSGWSGRRWPCSWSASPARLLMLNSRQKALPDMRRGRKDVDHEPGFASSSRWRTTPCIMKNGPRTLIAICCRTVPAWCRSGCRAMCRRRN